MANKKNPIPELSRFEDRDVLASTINVTKAGAGLSDALSVEPQEFHEGDTVYLVLQTTVTEVRHRGIKDIDALERRHVLETVLGSIVDGQAVAKLLDETKRKLAIRREEEAEARGVTTLPGVGVRDLDATE